MSNNFSQESFNSFVIGCCPYICIWNMALGLTPGAGMYVLLLLLIHSKIAGQHVGNLKIHPLNFHNRKIHILNFS
jgi:hypothetical protein